MAKKFTVGDGERLVRVLFYTLLGFDSLQLSVDCPTAPALSARRVSRDLIRFHTKLEGGLASMGGFLEILWLTSGAVDSTTTGMRPATATFY